MGFRPTWGRLDATGVMPLARTLDHVGPMARSIGDLQIIQKVLDPDGADYLHAELQTPISLGVAGSYYADAEDNIKNAMAQAIDVLGRHQINTR